MKKLPKRRIDPRNHRYSVSNGIAGLRKEVAKKYKNKYGVELDPETEIIATIGMQGRVSAICAWRCSARATRSSFGDPAFPIHIYAVAMAGANVIRVPLGNDQAFLDRIERTIDGLYPTPKLLILNYPHNPTAMTIEPDFWEQAIAMCRRHGIMIISDFAYGEICFDGYKAPVSSPPRREGDRRRVHDDVQELQHGRLALRLLRGQCRDGQGAGDDQRLLRLRHVRADSDRQRDRHARMRPDTREQQSKIYQERRDEVCRGLDKLGWTYEKPLASMFVWAKIKRRASEGAKARSTSVCG